MTAQDCDECGGEGIVTRAFATPHDQPCPKCSAPSAPTPGLHEALMAARDGLWRAFNMLSAINDSDPSADRMKAKMDAAEAMKAANRSLLASSPSTTKETP